MKAILTRYLPATNTRGTRIKAMAEGVASLTVAYDYAGENADNHYAAARAMQKRMAWTGELVSGGLPCGDYAHCFV